MNSHEFNIEVFSLTVCRTCLQSEEHLTPICDSKAAEMLRYCNFCKVSDNDGLPNQICLSCFQMLEQCYTFKKRCTKSEATLRKALNRNPKLNNQSSVEINLFTKGTKEQEATSLESSIDSSDVREDLIKNSRILADTSNKIGEHELPESPFSMKEDFTSFLELPLPPPLQYQCQNCDHSFSEERDLKIHQSIHNSDLICLACSKQFTGRQTLKRHLKIHLVQKAHVCKICSKSFAESYALVKHLRHHSGIPREKKHSCDECGQGFSEPYYLKVHMRKHTGERPFACPTCQKSFSDPRCFKTHVMIHGDERQFKCHYCPKTFVQKANWTKHLRVHTGEKPYLCKVCDKRFTQSCSLEKHLRVHSRDEVFERGKCSKRCPMKRHVCNSSAEREGFASSETIFDINLCDV